MLILYFLYFLNHKYKDYINLSKINDNNVNIKINGNNVNVNNVNNNTIVFENLTDTQIENLKYYNFVTESKIQIKDDYLYLENPNFEMFQIWSPYPKEINKDRKIFKVNSNEFFKLFKDMKDKYNFELTIFISSNGKRYYFIVEDIELDQYLKLKIKSLRNYPLLNKIEHGILYIDSSPSSNVFIPFDGSY